MNDWSSATGADYAKRPPPLGDGLFVNLRETLVSAGFLVRAVGLAVRAELLDLQAVGVVPTVLPGDVVPVLALLARESDLRTYVGCSHGLAFLELDSPGPTGRPGRAYHPGGDPDTRTTTARAAVVPGSG